MEAPICQPELISWECLFWQVLRSEMCGYIAKAYQPMDYFPLLLFHVGTNSVSVNVNHIKSHNRLWEMRVNNRGPRWCLLRPSDEGEGLSRRESIDVAGLVLQSFVSCDCSTVRVESYWAGIGYIWQSVARASLQGGLLISNEGFKSAVVVECYHNRETRAQRCKKFCPGDNIIKEDLTFAL